MKLILAILASLKPKPEPKVHYITSIFTNNQKIVIGATNDAYRPANSSTNAS